MQVSNTNTRLFIMQVNDTGIELASIQFYQIQFISNLSMYFFYKAKYSIEMGMQSMYRVYCLVINHFRAFQTETGRATQQISEKIPQTAIVCYETLLVTWMLVDA